jgi:hypothetical protein
VNHPDPHLAAAGPGELSPSDSGAADLLDTGSDPSASTGWGEPDRRATWGTEAALATLVILLLAAFGVVLGVVWQWATPGAGVLMTGEGPIHANPNSEHYFADDGWFALIGGVAGVVAAVACWTLARRHRGPVVMIGTVVGCLLSAVVAWQVGRHIGLAAFRDLLEHAATGRVFRRPARLAALGVLGVQGFAAAFTYTLLAGWSRYPTLRRPDLGDPDDPAWGGLSDPRGPAGPADRAAGEPHGGRELSGASGPTG